MIRTENGQCGLANFFGQNEECDYEVEKSPEMEKKGFFVTIGNITAYSVPGNMALTRECEDMQYTGHDVIIWLQGKGYLYTPPQCINYQNTDIITPHNSFSPKVTRDPLEFIHPRIDRFITAVTETTPGITRAWKFYPHLPEGEAVTNDDYTMGRIKNVTAQIQQTETITVHIGTLIGSILGCTITILTVAITSYYSAKRFCNKATTELQRLKNEQIQMEIKEMESRTLSRASTSQRQLEYEPLLPVKEPMMTQVTAAAHESAIATISLPPVITPLQTPTPNCAVPDGQRSGRQSACDHPIHALPTKHSSLTTHHLQRQGAGGRTNHNKSWTTRPGRM
ncbi:unnamed protein product [Sphagnum tenellum]